jgi:hypothetical protein
MKIVESKRLIKVLNIYFIDRIIKMNMQTKVFRPVLSFLIILLLSQPSLSQTKDSTTVLSGNSNLPKEKFKPTLTMLRLWGYNPDVLTISGRLVRWFDYAGPKETTFTISPDRMVWEYITAYCKPKYWKVTPYVYDAVDAQTGKHLSRSKKFYSRDISSLSLMPSSIREPGKNYFRCS